MAHETQELAEVRGILAELSSPTDEELVQALRGNSERAIASAATQVGGAPGGDVSGPLDLDSASDGSAPALLVHDTDQRAGAALVVDPGDDSWPFYVADYGEVQINPADGASNEALGVHVAGDPGGLAVGQNPGSTTLVVNTASDAIIMGSLPTVDPEVAGQIWANDGVLTVSAG